MLVILVSVSAGAVQTAQHQRSEYYNLELDLSDEYAKKKKGIKGAMRREEENEYKERRAYRRTG